MMNRDQPLDQFIIDQLAGDLLPKTGDEQIDGDRLTATGLLVIGPKMLAEQDKDKMVIDIVDDAGTPTSPMRIAHVRAAVAAGQQAARAGRLGDAAEEDLAWRRCAAHHEAAGDEARALAARASASGASLASQPRGRPSRRGTPKGRAGAVSLVGDHIRPTASS